MQRHYRKNDLLGEALGTLPDKKRNIVLMSYFLDMSDDEIDNLLLKELSKQKKGSILTRVKPFLKSRIISYLTLSVILFVLSFIMDYALYYRIMAMLCLSFAGLSGALSGSRKEKP